MSEHFAVLILFVITAGVAAVMMLIANLLGPRRDHGAKLNTYECGVEPRPIVRRDEEQVPIKYSTVALIFIIFDVETAFLLPWAVLFREQIQSGAVLNALVFIGIFLFLLLFGLVYAYRRNVFQWD